MVDPELRVLGLDGRRVVDASVMSSGMSSSKLRNPASTCAIGSLVDPELRVLGLDALRVVYASVMPKVVRGNTNAPTIMIVEKAVDLIKADQT